MILLPLLAAVGACWPSFQSLHFTWVDWQTTTHTHGYLIVGLCVWLIWRKFRNFNYAHVPRWWHLLPLCASSTIWLFAVQAGVQTVEFAVLPMVLWASVLA